MRGWPLILLFAAAACTPDYPYDRSGTWHLDETTANDDNLRAMVVNPADLVAGRGATDTIGPEAAQPVRRLLTGQRYPLQQSSVFKIEVTGSPQQQAPAGGSGAGQ